VDVPSTSAFAPNLPAVGGPTSTALTAATGEGTLAGIASRLRLSPTEVQSALRQGQSIASLAAEQSVPRESLAQFVGDQIRRGRAYTGQPPLEEDALDRMVDRALDRGRPQPSGASESAPGEAGGTYASNARVAMVGLPAGQTISLLA
jgi:hypothetical protein